jgi:aldose 1-epimerase
MATDARAAASTGAQAPLAPGKLLRIAAGALTVDVAPAAGGRIAQVCNDGVDWLVDFGARHAAMIAWGCFPMLPWAGRIRRGRFEFDGRAWQLPLNLGRHAIHGVGFALPWRVEAHGPSHVELALRLPEDERWPFGGLARQRIEVGDRVLQLQLSLGAGTRPMPAVIGWHPWFLKPDHVEFRPSRFYPRDAEGIAVRPVRTPPPGPWDDCFVNAKPIVLHRQGQRLRLTSDCRHWVVYDEPGHATCFEPQTGPPDAFSLAPSRIEPGRAITARFDWIWLPGERRRGPQRAAGGG